MRSQGFSLVELLVVMVIVSLLSTLVFGGAREVRRASSLAVSANNIRQLTAGGILYLADHDMTFWKYRENVPGRGVRWWFGFEPQESLSAPEGQRWFDPDGGTLQGYVPINLIPDPSFALTGKAFKPKYQFGYLGAGYNVLLAASDANTMRAWMGVAQPRRLTQLKNPERVVVFATSAQVNDFQGGASRDNPMIEEFYGIDDRERTVHFRHNGKAMVGFANGAVGFLEPDESTLDRRAPDAWIGRFAPVGDNRYLL